MKYPFCLIIIILSLLVACASQPFYTPDGPATRKEWTACRIAYEDAHNPPNPAPEDAAGFILGAAASNMISNSKLEGPAMEKDVNTCMKAKGYHLEKQP